jgi:hypothetical protein
MNVGVAPPALQEVRSLTNPNPGLSLSACVAAGLLARVDVEVNAQSGAAGDDDAGSDAGRVARSMSDVNTSTSRSARGATPAKKSR